MQCAAHRKEESDSEDDPDYIPPAEGLESSDEGRAVKRARPSMQPTIEEDSEEKRSARDALWASFQASLAEPQSNFSEREPKRMVKVEKRYRFAGEEAVEIKYVSEDSEDAKKWPKWTPLEEVPSPSSKPMKEPSSPTQSFTPSSSSNPAPPGIMKPTKRPGPRKPKTQLGPLPGAQKVKKLTTLDKSTMDWRSHVEGAEASGSSKLKDELEANRRGGGYLEKVEFLKRVEERKEEALEASKSGKRRRG